MTALADISPGAPFEGVYAVRRVERRLARTGRPFLSVELGDASGTARAVIFEQPDWFRERLAEGRAAHVSGRASERGGRLELVISQVRPADDAASDALSFHGCTDARFVDLRAATASRTVTFGSGPTPFSYNPNCLRVAAGQAVTFTGAFSVHPLSPGVHGSPSANPPGNPIPATASGDRVAVTFPTAGVFPFFCTVHGAGGMTGVVRVEAP